MLQKLEADVRQHIRIEQQLKLHIESIQEKLEEDEKVIDEFKLHKSRFKREQKRMDEMLTLREEEITKLQENVDQLTEQLERKEKQVINLTQNLDKTKQTLTQERNVLENERKALTRFNHSVEDTKFYSKSNERPDSSALKSNSKKPVSRMYTSLYNSSQSKSKPCKIEQMKDYEKLYKDFMKSKRGEHSKEK